MNPYKTDRLPGNVTLFPGKDNDTQGNMVAMKRG